MTAGHDHHHAPLPTSGRPLDAVALSATLHCLTGCAIGEVAGMVIGTALGFDNFSTIVVSVALAFAFGYGLTSLPLLRAGLGLAAVAPIAFASDTFSIATMEVIDNGIMLIVPGAMDAGISSLLFWGSLSFALVLAGVFAFPVNRWLIARGKGHAAVHATGIHGGPSPKVVGAVVVIAAAFGTSVLVAEAMDGSAGGHGDHGTSAQAESSEAGTGTDGVRGLAVSEGGLRLVLGQREVPAGADVQLGFTIVDRAGIPTRDFEIEHEQPLHLIVVRRDMTGFQHLHPEMRPDGGWSTPIRLDEPGSYRVFADFKQGGTNRTLAADLAVDGSVDWQELPPAAATVTTEDGYEVRVDGGQARAGGDVTIRFTIERGGAPVDLEPYLGAGGHLVALREGDLAYLHVHPTEEVGHAGHTADGLGSEVSFATSFPTEGRYRLFLQFKHGGVVHTAAFTSEVTAP